MIWIEDHWYNGICLVFSTCVEVIPVQTFYNSLYFGILHVCGGDPSYCRTVGYLGVYSPRVWRWSQAKIIIHAKRLLIDFLSLLIYNRLKGSRKAPYSFKV